MRQTKIIATVGPASDTDDMLDALIAAGTDIVRLNFSHGTHDTHAATFARVRSAAARAGWPWPFFRILAVRRFAPVCSRAGDPFDSTPEANCAL